MCRCKQLLTNLQTLYIVLNKGKNKAYKNVLTVLVNMNRLSCHTNKAYSFEQRQMLASNHQTNSTTLLCCHTNKAYKNVYKYNLLSCGSAK
jgi:hypothetical protein